MEEPEEVEEPELEESLEDLIEEQWGREEAVVEPVPIVEEAVVEPLPIVEEVAAEPLPIIEEVEVKLDEPVAEG